MQFSDWFNINENANKYSIALNYRTTLPEVIDGWAKLVMGYISASLKNQNYPVKQVYTEHPIRLVIGTRAFDDGEWVGVLTYDKTSGSMLISRGFYKKGSKTVAIQSTKSLSGTSPAEITKEVLNYIHILEKEPIKPPSLKPIKKKPGPKR